MTRSEGVGNVWNAEKGLRLMNEEKRAKLKILDERLKELNELNWKIGKLSFYLNEDAEGKSKQDIDQLEHQLEIQIELQIVLVARILRGNY